jgi:ketosteroid isomerase-like protein
MSDENVEIVEAAYESLSRLGTAGFLEHWAEDLDHRSVEGAPDDHGPIHGKEGMRRYIQDWMDMFDEFWIQPLELLDAGHGTVVAALRFGGRARLSGIEADQKFGVVFEIRDGKIARGREYSTHSEALEAAGLQE